MDWKSIQKTASRSKGYGMPGHKYAGSAMAKFAKSRAAQLPAKKSLTQLASAARKKAEAATLNAQSEGSSSAYKEAAQAHEDAAEAYRNEWAYGTHDRATELKIEKALAAHEEAAQQHSKKAAKGPKEKEAMAEDTTDVDEVGGSVGPHKYADDPPDFGKSRDKKKDFAEAKKRYEKEAKASQTGSRGGTFYVNAAGNKVYLKK